MFTLLCVRTCSSDTQKCKPDTQKCKHFCVSEHVLLIHRSVNTSVYQNMFFCVSCSCDMFCVSQELSGLQRLYSAEKALLIHRTLLQKRPIALLIHRKKELACAEENAFWEENAFSFAYMSSSTHERNYLVHRIYNYHIVCKAFVSGLRFCVSEHVLLIHRSVDQIHRSVNTSVYQNMFFWYTAV